MEEFITKSRVKIRNSLGDGQIVIEKGSYSLYYFINENRLQLWNCKINRLMDIPYQDIIDIIIDFDNIHSRRVTNREIERYDLNDCIVEILSIPPKNTFDYISFYRSFSQLTIEVHNLSSAITFIYKDFPNHDRYIVITLPSLYNLLIDMGE